MTRRVQRHYAKDRTKQCRQRGSHDDAKLLVEYLYSYGGSTAKPAEQIALDLGWEKRVGIMRHTDMQRFHIARNHVRDGLDKHGQPCTGYTLHYRHTGKDSRLWLIDPNGGLDERKEAAKEELRGDLQQQLNLRTINGRRIATAEALSEWCLKSTPVDGVGHRLMIEYSMELRKTGVASDQLIAEIHAWLAAT